MVEPNSALLRAMSSATIFLLLKSLQHNVKKLFFMRILSLILKSLLFNKIKLDNKNIVIAFLPTFFDTKYDVN